jgi:hypothetical protein
VIRRRLVIDKSISELQAASALSRVRRWHLRHAAVEPLLEAAWAYRHNMTVADALYVALAERLGAALCSLPTSGSRTHLRSRQRCRCSEFQLGCDSARATERLGHVRSARLDGA